ncbi:Pyridoxamine 5'-phosphate oxidase like [Poseidonocella pacifica]|uniref:Pyridoxamine 5'-phosphate oxidase like n=1 Tax=Poseidonocella pacifica TaxID=871651 RepID=A0A1I0WDH1_9RHOB|nr:pyridoxamine 5'-phosphate oxidase family protein [Poseidonocella pacifica]SFA86681.1 Pyridoxamine 5'-phosphate oxidase like [Poseidonocella pacifica]
MKDLTTDQKDTFWTRLDKVRAGMLHTDPDRVVPMSHYVDVERGVLWFITAQGNDCHDAAEAGKSVHFVVADASAKIYARVDGKLSSENDPDKLDELWSPIAAAWFEDGREDEDVRLVKFTPSKAEAWLTDGAAGFLYQMARANLVENATPDMGEHGIIRF